MLEYTPNVCETCIAQQKIDELMFENKKIYVRTIEEDTTPEIIMEEDQTQSGEVSKRPIQLLDDSLEDDPPVDEYLKYACYIFFLNFNCFPYLDYETETSYRKKRSRLANSK